MYSNGDVYEGALEHEKKQGNGKYISVDGTVYDGDYNDELRHGNGVLTCR